MPSSTFTATKIDILRGALRLIGNSNPSSTEEGDAAKVLAALLKRWDGEGTWIWTISKTPTILSLQAGVETYATGDLGPPTQIASDILRLRRVDVWRGGKPDYQLHIRSQEQWMASALRKETGEPIEVYLEVAPFLANNLFFVAPVPAAALEVRYYFKRRIYDFDGPTDTPDLPQEWLQTLKFGLASEIGPEYGLPLDRQAYLDNKSGLLLRQMQKADSEVSDPSRQKGVFF